MNIKDLNDRLTNGLEVGPPSRLLRDLLQLNLEDRAELAGDAIVDLYDQMDAGAADRHLLLVMLAVAGREEHLHPMVERLVSDPPQNWEAVGYVLSPLMQRRDWDVDVVFPRILEAVTDPAMVVPTLDLANFVTREGMLEIHPAKELHPLLMSLLGQVVGRLGKMEEQPRTFGETVSEIQHRLAEAIALTVALCNALGLIGDPAAIGKLNQALQLKHRRVQAEAAGALTRLGDAAGRRHLIELANEPSARLQVLAYAEELGISDDIPEALKSEDARAIAELAVWLAQPHQVGLPPSHLEIIDRRRMFWPSFSLPIQCLLIRYAYDLGTRKWSNIGIVGPVVHCMQADLGNLSFDDIYACYAGWHAEHDEIFEVPAEQWNARQQSTGAELVRYLEREGFSNVQPSFLGMLLDEVALVGMATRDGKPCSVATDGLEIVSFGSAVKGSLPVEDVWSIFKGRRMLRTFNGSTLTADALDELEVDEAE
jgi:hypothetical protein